MRRLRSRFTVGVRHHEMLSEYLIFSAEITFGWIGDRITITLYSLMSEDEPHAILDSESGKSP